MEQNILFEDFLRRYHFCYEESEESPLNEKASVQLHYQNMLISKENFREKRIFISTESEITDFDGDNFYSRHCW